MPSLYENLAVYKRSLELVAYLENTVRGFDRYHKYAIGSDLRNTARAILMLVAKANTRERRSSCLAEAIERVEELKILANVAWEVKAFKSHKSLENSTRLVVDIGRQCEGWLRNQNAAGKGPAAAR